MPPTMRALVLEHPGSSPQLAVTEAPEPVPGPGEALVQVAACGLCHHDVLVAKGLLRRGVKPGLILGHEVSGTVSRVGPGVRSVQPGDRVVTILTDACGQCNRCTRGLEHRCVNGRGIGHARDGGFAQYLAVSEFSLVPVPDDLDLLSAALLACPMGVALQGTQIVAHAQPGEVAVVTGASGGLGVHALQFGAALGCRMLAVTSTPWKSPLLEEHGANEVVPSGPLDFSEIVRALTEDRGADMVVDTVGSALFPSTWLSLAQYGRWLVLGEVAGGAIQLDPAEVIFRDARILGSAGASRDIVIEAAAMVSQGRVRPVVAHTLPLEEAARAMELLSSRSVLGRILLVPS